MCDCSFYPSQSAETHERWQKQQPVLQLKAKQVCLKIYTADDTAKKKKWSKGKVKDKANNAVLLDKATYDKLFKEVGSYRFVSVSVLVERLKINGSLARKALRELESKGIIKAIDKHSAQQIYSKPSEYFGLICSACDGCG